MCDLRLYNCNGSSALFAAINYQSFLLHLFLEWLSKKGESTLRHSLCCLAFVRCSICFASLIIYKSEWKKKNWVWTLLFNYFTCFTRITRFTRTRDFYWDFREFPTERKQLTISTLSFSFHHKSASLSKKTDHLLEECSFVKRKKNCSLVTRKKTEFLTHAAVTNQLSRQNFSSTCTRIDLLKTFERARTLFRNTSKTQIDKMPKNTKRVFKNHLSVHCTWSPSV